MSEQDNYRHWTDAERGRYEVWYVTWNDPATEQGYWLRYIVKQPVESYAEPHGELWFARFDPKQPSRTFGVHKRVPFSTVAAGEAPFVLSVGGARLTNDHAVGSLAGDGHEIRWDLRWEPARDTLRILPDVMYMKAGVAPTVVQMPNWRVPLSGTLVIDGETFRFDRVPAGQTHLWGLRHGYSWAWAHCVDFLDAPDAAFELIAARLHQRGMTSPPLAAVAIDVDGERLRFNQVRHWLKNRARWETGRVEIEAWSPFVRAEIELTATADRMINCPYFDPDGTEVFCVNTEIGDATIRIYKRAGLSWREHRVLTASRRAHFETGGRVRDPAVTREHILVR